MWWHAIRSSTPAHTALPIVHHFVDRRLVTVRSLTHVRRRSSYLGVTLVHDIVAFRGAADSGSTTISSSDSANGKGNGNGHGSCGGNGHSVDGGNGNATSAHGGNGNGDSDGIGAAGNSHGADGGSCTLSPHHAHARGHVYGADLPGKSFSGLLGGVSWSGLPSTPRHNLRSSCAEPANATPESPPCLVTVCPRRLAPSPKPQPSYLLAPWPLGLVSAFRRRVDAELPGMYTWFDDTSLHVTIRSLMG